MTKYAVIVADPPWRFGDSLTMSDVKRGADAQYASTMSDEEIIGLGPLVQSIAEDPSILCLWVPDSMLQLGLDVMKAWGYTQKQIVTWVKTADSERRGHEEIPEDLKMAFGMGRVFRNCDEHALIGTRGQISKILRSKSERNVILGPNMKHSAKPERLQNALDRMFPDQRKIELFSRRRRPGWVTLGNECPGQEGHDIRALIQAAGLLAA